MQLSKHFSLAELTVSAWARDNGVDNTPSTDTEWRNLRYLADQLEIARAGLGGKPIIVSSAFRNARVNKAVGGVPNSAHQQGLACDFVCPGYGDVTAVCNRLAELPGLQFDQIIWEYGRWCHLGLRAPGVPPRRQLLTKRAGQGYVPGLPR